MENAICYCFSYTIEAIIVYQYSTSLFPEKRTPHKIPTLIALYVSMLFFSLFEYTWLNTILFVLTNYIFLARHFVIKWYAALFHTVIMTAVMAMCELLLYGIILNFTPLFFEKTTFLYNLAILTVFSKILYFAIMNLLIHLFKRKGASEQQYTKASIILTLIPVTSIFVMLTFVGISEIVNLPRKLDIMVVISAVFSSID